MWNRGFIITQNRNPRASERYLIDPSRDKNIIKTTQKQWITFKKKKKKKKKKRRKKHTQKHTIDWLLKRDTSTDKFADKTKEWGHVRVDTAGLFNACRLFC